MLQVSAVFPYRSGLAEDVSINVWHFRTVDPEPTEAEITTAATSLIDFYYEPPSDASTTDTIAQAMAPWINFSFSNCYLRIVGVDQVTGAELGAAIITNYDGPSQPDPSDSNLPLEVAICCSFKGYYSEGPVLERARRRGRVYIGPLNDTVLQGNGTAAPPRPSVDFVNLLTAKMQDLRENAQTGAGTGGASAPWVIWSRAGGAIHNVVGGWVDNAWDTQRRRGNETTTRTQWGDQT